MYNDRLLLIKEFHLTIIFYGCFGVQMKTKKINTDTGKLYYEFNVPTDTDIILNGKKSFCGEELSNAFKEMIEYYYTKFQEEFKEPFDMKIECSFRRETHTVAIFKYNLEKIINYSGSKFLGLTEKEKKDFIEIINKSIEYIGANGINVDLNGMINKLTNF